MGDLFVKQEDEHEIDDWMREITLTSKIRSDYLCPVIGFSAMNDNLAIIMPYYHNGDLYTLLHRKKVDLNMLQRIRMARHMALGLDALHSANIMHRDIKSM